MKIANEYDVMYKASIVTNGYLIDNEVVELFRKWKISHIQITVDGNPGYHNKRRLLKENSEGTFEKIIENLCKLKATEFKVTIRTNIDKENIVHLDEMFSIFEENRLNDEKFSFSLARVIIHDDRTDKNNENCFTPKEFAVEIFRLKEKLIKTGFNVSYFPEKIATFCSGNTLNSYVIDPDGDLYKCWEMIGIKDASIGNLRKFKNILGNNYNEIDFLLITPFDNKECLSCKILPLCMGGCQRYNMKNEKYKDCNSFKYTIDEVIRLECELKNVFEA